MVCKGQSSQQECLGHTYCLYISLFAHQYVFSKLQEANKMRKANTKFLGRCGAIDCIGEILVWNAGPFKGTYASRVPQRRQGDDASDLSLLVGMISWTLPDQCCTAFFLGCLIWFKVKILGPQKWLKWNSTDKTIESWVKWWLNHAKPLWIYQWMVWIRHN